MMHAHGPEPLRHWGRSSPGVKALAVAVAILVAVLGAMLLFHRFEGVRPRHWNVGVSARDLLLYTLYTLLRLVTAYAISLVLAFGTALWVTSSTWAERWALPVLDVLQSLPVLAVFPVAVAAFATWGFLEGAATLVLVMAMLWPLLFSLVAAIRSVPRDVRDAARLFGARGWSYTRTLLLPASVPALVTGSMLAFGAGWNIVIVAEYISYAGQTWTLPGLGSLLDRAVYAVPENHSLFALTLVTMVLTIVAINVLVWHRLLLRSRRYVFD